jgi:hypothetical protein
VRWWDKGLKARNVHDRVPERRVARWVCEKTHPNCGQSIFYRNLWLNLSSEYSSYNMWDTSAIFKKLLKVIIHPSCENSPSLVTLSGSIGPQFLIVSKRLVVMWMHFWRPVQKRGFECISGTKKPIEFWSRDNHATGNGRENFEFTLPKGAYRVARWWFVFKPKIPIWVNFGGSCSGRRWYILWPLVYIFYGHLVYFVAIWYSLLLFGIVFTVLVCCTKKNLATLGAWSAEFFFNFCPKNE